MHSDIESSPLVISIRGSFEFVMINASYLPNISLLPVLDDRMPFKNFIEDSRFHIGEVVFFFLLLM